MLRSSRTAKLSAVYASYLRRGEEDVVRYVAHAAGDDAQSQTWEHIGVVSLAGVKGASVSQHHFVKRTPAGKDAPTLEERKES